MSHRVALVTGAARGIGRGVAVALAQQGFDVLVHYRASRADAEETARLCGAHGVRAVLHAADVNEEPQARDLVLQAQRQLGGPHVLVNVVGNYVHKSWLDTSPEEWHEMLQSNLTATFYTCRAAVPLMREAGWGRIVNFGYAGAEHLTARPGIVPYAIAKSGVIALTRAIARTEAGHGISANVVSPGVIETSVSQPVNAIPAGRLGLVEEVVGAVMTYVMGSGYITGQVTEVAGGWNL